MFLKDEIIYNHNKLCTHFKIPASRFILFVNARAEVHDEVEMLNQQGNFIELQKKM